MSPWKEETRICGYTLWIYSLATLERTDENRIFLVRSPHHKHFGQAQHLVLWALWWHQLFFTSELEPHWSFLGRTELVSVDICSEFIHWKLWRTLIWIEYILFFRKGQAFCQSSAPGTFSTLAISVVLYSLTRAILMIPGKEERRVRGYTLWINPLSSLENTNETRMFLVHWLHHKHFHKAEHLVFWALWWHQFFLTC